MASTLIASKLLEKDPIYLESICEYIQDPKIGHNEVRDRETEILSVLECNFDRITHLDFALLYLQMIDLDIKTNHKHISMQGLDFI